MSRSTDSIGTGLVRRPSTRRTTWGSGTSPPLSRSPTGAGKAFVEKHERVLGKKPSEAYAIYGYESALVTLEALRRGGAKDRPAICAVLPMRKGQVYALDLGANADCTPEHLVQFAIMGSTLVKAVEGKRNPTVGLLNIGSEEIKGNEVVKKAGELLRSAPVNFYGNVEGDDIYMGTTDVVVCDGFVGNVMLKTSEGLAHMLSEFLKTEFRRNLLTRAAAGVVYPVLAAFKRRIDPRRYNGATLVGLKGVVVKSHGGADAFAFTNALQRATLEVQHGVLDKIAQRIAEMPHVVPADNGAPGTLAAHA